MLNLVNAYSGGMKPHLYRGEDCTDKFWDTLNNSKNDVVEHMKRQKDIVLSDLDEIKHLEAKNGLLCTGTFNNKVESIERRSPTAHMKCNIDFCFTKYHIPGFFHNL